MVKDCPACKGVGTVTDVTYDKWDNRIFIEQECPYCEGTGVNFHGETI